MDQEAKWEESQEFKNRKAKKERGVRIASFLTSDVYELDFKPYIDKVKKASMAQAMNSVNDHGALAFALGFERGTDAFEAALIETAKDANLDLSEPKESEEPNIQP